MSGNKKQPLVPRLRFPEFCDEPPWSFQPLGKLAKRSTRKNADGDIARVLTNSAEFGVIDQRDFFDKDIANQGNLEGYYIVEEGDYVYNPRISATAPVGPVSKNRIGLGVMSPLYTVFRFNNKKNDLYAYYFKSTHWHQYMRQVSSTGARHDRMSITNDDFMGLPLPVSKPEEQQKIADCLSSLDDLITAETQKLAIIKTHKKGLMQQLFPRGGETVPRLRFPEFLGRASWKSKTLSKIATICSGSTPSRAEPSFYNGGTIPWVKTTDLNNGFIVQTEEYVTHVAKMKINPAGSVLVAMYGGFKQIGRTGYLEVPAATNQALSVLNADEKEVLPIYLLMWMNARVEDWKKIASSSRKAPNITGTDVANFRIVYPCKKEQQKIADCLLTIDSIIAAQNKKITFIKTFGAEVD